MKLIVIFVFFFRLRIEQKEKLKGPFNCIELFLIQDLRNKNVVTDSTKIVF